MATPERTGLAIALAAAALLGLPGSAAAQPAHFAGASADGSHVLFTTQEPLVAADTDFSADISERSSGVTSLVSTGPTDSGGPQVLYFDAIAEGSRAFFTTSARLVGNAVSWGPHSDDRPPVVGTVGTPPGRPGRIVFVRQCPGDTSCYGGIYTVRPDGRAPKKISEDIFAEEPAFSPNGRLIAFSSARDGDHEIYVMRPDGTGVRQVTDDPEDDYAPAFLADGRILYAAQSGGDYATSVVNADGSNPHQIVATVGAASTDGRRIAVIRCPLGKCGISLYRPNGELIRRLTRAREGHHTDPDYDLEFSPNGRLIAFTGFRRVFSHRDLIYSTEVYLMRSNGRHLRRITPLRGPLSNYHVSFSPDGRNLLYDSDNHGKSGHIIVRSLRSGRVRKVPAVGGPGIDFQPDWQPLPRRR